MPDVAPSPRRARASRTPEANTQRLLGELTAQTEANATQLGVLADTTRDLATQVSQVAASVQVTNNSVVNIDRRVTTLEQQNQHSATQRQEYANQLKFNSVNWLLTFAAIVIALLTLLVAILGPHLTLH